MLLFYLKSLSLNSPHKFVIVLRVTPVIGLWLITDTVTIQVVHFLKTDQKNVLQLFRIFLIKNLNLMEKLSQQHLQLMILNQLHQDVCLLPLLTHLVVVGLVLIFRTLSVILLSQAF